MSGQSKKMSGKFLTARQVIDKVLEITKLQQPDLAIKCEILPNTLEKAISRDTLSEEIVLKISLKYGFRKEWLKTGEEPIFGEKPYNGEKPSDNNGKDIEPVLQELIERNDKYRLVPTIILDKYEILSNRELDSREKLLQKMLDQAQEISATKQFLLDEKDRLIGALETEISELRAKLNQIPPTEGA